MKKIAALGSIDVRSVIRFIVNGLSPRTDFKYTLYSCKSFKKLRYQYEVFKEVGEKGTKSYQPNNRKLAN